MKRMTPEIEPRSSIFHTIPAGGRLITYIWLKVQQAHMHGRSSIELGFETETLWFRSGDITTGTPSLLLPME
ncbi:hypothetical protein AVEN_181694-1 [Araneus ventricosus]|uniref:Uncharacterized protein n=1 Tax=Araneus ventricosus TaxID=182803 RepID=A0A4Y2Q4C0_ARAVE|nr:hypothetical protein AVEN_181694-1 [Araneus ventricosus]